MYFENIVPVQSSVQACELDSYKLKPFHRDSNTKYKDKLYIIPHKNKTTFKIKAEECHFYIFKHEMKVKKCLN